MIRLRGSFRRRIPAVMLCGFGGVLLTISSCSYVYDLTIRGVIVDETTGEPIADASLGATTIIDGQIVGSVPAMDENGLPYGIPSDANGAFALVISHYNRKPDRPERIQLLVLRDGCQQRVMIEVNEDTADFVEADNTVSSVELTEPILVPSCEQSP